MFRIFPTLEKIFIVVLLVIIGLTGFYLYARFIRDNSDLIATEGGIFTEGVVGRPMHLNPVLVTGNPVDRDIVQLVFSGLTKFNPHTGLIEDDIATSEKSKDNLSYTFTIVPDARWHDGVPVTADDVIFTYQTVIQDEEFPNEFLKQVFADVTVKLIDEKTVEFQLEEPYSFFLANVTLGLIPKHQLEFIPVSNIALSEFNQSPIGTGPYKFVSWSTTNETNEITLVKNEEFYGNSAKIQTMIIRSFQDQQSLLLAENTLTGFRYTGDKNPGDVFGETSRFEVFPYFLPQYSALFLHTGSDMLSNRKVRFALLLATDKEEIAAAVGDAVIVDTPILESKADLDIEFSLERAMGAFFDTEWNLPEKVKARIEKEEKENGDADDEAEAADEDPDSSGGPEEDALIEESTELTFTIEAINDSWISLAVDGVPQDSFLLTKGQSKVFTASTALTFFTVGNAAGIAIDVNGLSLKSLGAEGEVVKNIVLDRLTLSEYLDEQALPEEDPEDDIDEDLLEEVDEVMEDFEEEEEVVVKNEDLEKIRINDDGERLILRLVTVQEPTVFLKVAELIQKQWLEAGAKVVIETYSLADLQEKIRDRDYDILLFGQNLGYNLDAFPFWHSSQAEDGLNLSDYRSLEADNLLVDIRRTFDERTKQEHLDKLKKEIAVDTPAVFLYNPSHYYLVSKSVKNVQLGSLSRHADRFTDLVNWYIKEDYELKEPFSFSILFKWIFGY